MSIYTTSTNILIHIGIKMSIFSFTTFIRTYLLFKFLCFKAPTAVSNNDNRLIYVNNTQLKSQNKNVKIVKI